MAGYSYDFNLVINTKAKSLNYGFIQDCNLSKIKLLLHYMGFLLLFKVSGVIELE